MSDHLAEHAEAVRAAALKVAPDKGDPIYLLIDHLAELIVVLGQRMENVGQLSAAQLQTMLVASIEAALPAAVAAWRFRNLVLAIIAGLVTALLIGSAGYIGGAFAGRDIGKAEMWKQCASTVVDYRGGRVCYLWVQPPPVPGDRT